MHTLADLYRNRAVRYTVTLVFVAVVITALHPAQVLRAAGTVNGLNLLLALILTAPFLALKALRWYVMLKQAGIRATPVEATTSLIGGMGLALITPARVGEVVRAAYLPDPRKWTIGGLVLLDKGFDVLTLCALSIAGAWNILGASAGLVLGAITAAGLLFVYFPGTVRRALHGAGGPGGVAGRLTQVWSSLDALTTRATTVYLLLTACSFLIVLVQFDLILASWRVIGAEAVFFTFPLVILTNVLPVTIGGIGVREAAAAVLLAHFGVPGTEAAVAAFLMFTVNTALPGIIGALLLPAAGTHTAPSLDRT